MIGRLAGLVLTVVVAAGCVPGTYYDVNDRYVIGMRWFDRDRYDEAIHYWKPLAEAGDCDAQYRYGTLFLLGAGVPKAPGTAVEWWLKAANQGQYRAQVALGHAYSREALLEGTAYSWLLLAMASVPPSQEQFRQGLGAWDF